MSRQYKSTMVELVQELEQRLPTIHPRFKSYLEVTIEEAKRGEYHDYKNDKYICGKVAVVGRLVAMHLFDLADRVKQGEFDEQADEADKEMMRKDLDEGCSTPAQAEAMKGILGLGPEQ